MSTEDDKALRQAVRKAIQLPEPTWNLLARTTKRWSRADTVLKTPEMKKSTATTATNVERFLYDIKADEEAREGGKK